MLVQLVVRPNLPGNRMCDHLWGANDAALG